MFNLVSQHPNAIAPGKRPHTTLTHTIVSDQGVPRYLFGCPGGDAQVQAIVQCILNTVLFNMNPQQAVSLPRFATSSYINSFYPHTCDPDKIYVHPNVSRSIRYALTQYGHHPINGQSLGEVGHGAIVSERDPSSGVLSSGVDPLRPGMAMGW